MSSDLTYAQKLATIDDEWEEGPELYNEETDYYHCLVQVRPCKESSNLLLSIDR